MVKFNIITKDNVGNRKIFDVVEAETVLTQDGMVMMFGEESELVYVVPRFCGVERL